MRYEWIVSCLPLLLACSAGDDTLGTNAGSGGDTPVSGSGGKTATGSTSGTGGDAAAGGDTATGGRLGTGGSAPDCVPPTTPEPGIYVATDGDDSNLGSHDSPYATFAKAVSMMKAGDTCIIRGGRYEEELVVNLDGTEAAPVTVKAAECEQVTITTTKFVNGWQPHSGGIFKAAVSMERERANQVYYDSKKMELARWPNDSDDDPFTFEGHAIIDGGASFMNVRGIPDINWVGADVWYLGEHAGTTWTRTITQSTPTRLDYEAVDISKWPFSNHNPTHPAYNDRNRGQIVLLNKLEALDHEREWFYDGTTLYFQPPGGELPLDGTVEVPTRKSNVRISGDHVVVDGITAFAGNVEITGNYSTFSNSHVVHGMERLDSLTNKSASTSDACIEVGGQFVNVLGNTVEGSSFNGILARGWSAADVLIEGNTIRNTDTVGVHATPIRSKAPRVRILKNTVSHTGRDGIFVSGQDSEVAYNDISYATMLNDDSGIFYTVGTATDRRHIEVHHNWFHDSYGPTYAHQKTAGIYLDNRSKGFLVHHNVVWNISWSGIQLNWDTWENDMFNNTLWKTGGAMDAWINGYVQKDNRIFNNYADSGEWLTDGYELQNNLIQETSPFEDAGSLNFTPADGSPLLDQGTTIVGFEQSFSGSAPDIGAYERGGVAWTAGVNAIEDD